MELLNNNRETVLCVNPSSVDMFHIMMLTAILQVRLTQRAIKQVLTERHYSWDEARKLARDDPEIDLSGEGPAYTPSAFEEDYEDTEEDLIAQEHIREESRAKPVTRVDSLESIRPSSEQRQSALP